MKHIKEYEESEIKDLVSDLRKVGQSEWTGYFITYVFYGNDGIGEAAMAVVGDSWKSIALGIFSAFGMGETEEELEELEIINIDDLKTIESIFDEIDNLYSSDMGTNWSNLDYKYVEMTPKVLVNSSDVESLLDFGKAMMMGRNTFTDFESKILQLK
jgi:hypothetical protein